MDLTIVICSIRPNLAIATVVSLLGQIHNLDEIIIIFDTVVGSEVTSSIEVLSSMCTIRVIYLNKNMGLSYCRNLACKQAKNAYIIFFDDDTLIGCNTIDIYRKRFSEGATIVGGPLVLPKSLYPLPIWMPYGTLAYIGIHWNTKRIWGGNFGFNNMKAAALGITFREDLGRKGGRLQSGEETLFNFLLSKIEGNYSLFDEEATVYHYINPSRFSFLYLLKRIMWQGICEARKNTLISSLNKDFKRCFTTQSVIKLFFCLVPAFIFYTGFLIGGIIGSIERKIGFNYD